MKNAKAKPDKEKLTVRVFAEPLAYMLPFLTGVLIFTLYPFVNVLLISFKEGYQILSGEYGAVGLANYRFIFNDQDFLLGLKNTGLYILGVVPVSTCLALLFAVLLNRRLRFTRFFQTAYFLPMVTSVTAVGLVWKWMYNFDYGFLNYFLSLFGISAINWLNDPKFGLPALILYGIWSILPFTVILLLAGLQNIDPQYFTAARADGARAHTVFFRITAPLLAPSIGLVLIVNIISTSKVFTELFPLFNGKPGAAYSLYTVIYYLYNMFYNKWKLGPAAASAVILFLMVSLLTMLQLFLQRKWKNY
jgi:multiple sugar transport system permease protein